MGFLMLGYAVIQHPVLALVPLLLAVWSLAVKLLTVNQKVDKMYAVVKQIVEEGLL